MSGVNYLLDSCFLIRWYGRHEEALELIKQHHLSFEQCAYSVISYAEVLSFKQATEQDDKNLRSLFARFGARLELTDEIIEATILLRKNYAIKLPDALILATAKTYRLTLLTFDKKLEKIYRQLGGSYSTLTSK